MRRPITTTTVAAFALLLAACGTDEDVDTPDDLPDNEQPPATEELDDDALDDDAPDEGALDEEAAQPEDPLADLPDLQAQVEDGVFRGEGILLPIPDGWEFEPAAQLQGQVLATEGDEGMQQIFGQAVDVEGLPEAVTFEELLDSNRDQFDVEPAVDQEIELEGAQQAHELRYEELPATQEGLPEVSIVLIVAEDGDGRLGSFNYAAATDEFEESVAERFVTETGFDPDSDPSEPMMPPAPEGQG